MSRWKNLVARWGSGAGETDDVRIDASTETVSGNEYDWQFNWYEHTDKH